MLRWGLILLLLTAPVCAQELKLNCRLLWVSEGSRKSLPVLFNPLSPGFQIESRGPDSGAMRVEPQIDELSKAASRVLDFYPNEWAEVEHRMLTLRPSQRQVLPYLDEAIVEEGPWSLHLPLGTEIDLQYRRQDEQPILGVSCRGFTVRPAEGKPNCRWTTCTREIRLRYDTLYSFASLVDPEALPEDSWLLKGYSSLRDRRAELILFLEVAR